MQPFGRSTMESQKVNSYSLHISKQNHPKSSSRTCYTFQCIGNQRDQLYPLCKAVLLEPGDGCSAATPTRHSARVQKWHFHLSAPTPHLRTSFLIPQNTSVLWKSSGLSTSTSVRLQRGTRKGQTKGQHSSQPDVKYFGDPGVRASSDEPGFGMCTWLMCTDFFWS